MRIADNSLSATISLQLNQQQGTISSLETQLSTGKALNVPSDDPAAVTQVLQLSTQAAQMDDWQTNAQTATAWLGTANVAVNSTLQSLQSARTTILQSLNTATQTPGTYQGLGKQLQGILSTMVATANTQLAGRPIFAGTSASPSAYSATGTYLGNNDVPTVVVGPGSGGGQTAALSVSGETLFGSGATSVFAVLQAAVTALSSGTPTAAQLNAALSGIDASITTANQAAATLGTASQQVQGINAALTTQLSSIKATQANLEDVNIATVTTQLGSQQVGYQAAMWAASKAIPETLAKFL